MSEKIAIIGCNEHQIDLIKQAKTQGFETHVFAWQLGDEGENIADYFYPITITDKQAILEKCKEIKPLGVISMASDLAAITASYVSSRLGLIGNSEEVVRTATNKIAFRKCMERNGILQPAYVAVGDVFPEAEIEKLKYPIVVKPSDRSGNRSVTLAHNRKELLKALIPAKEISFERKAIVEEYVIGNYYSCECISREGIHKIIAITKRESLFWNNRFLDYQREQSSTNIISSDTEKHIKRILDAVGIQNGASSVEFIIDKKGKFVVIEMMSSLYGDFISTDLIPCVYGLNIMKAVINVACGGNISVLLEGSREKKPKENKRGKVCFVLSQKDYRQYLACKKAGKVIRSSGFESGEQIPEEVCGICYGYFVVKEII